MNARAGSKPPAWDVNDGHSPAPPPKSRRSSMGAVPSEVLQHAGVAVAHADAGVGATTDMEFPAAYKDSGVGPTTTASMMSERAADIANQVQKDWAGRGVAAAHGKKTELRYISLLSAVCSQCGIKHHIGATCDAGNERMRCAGCGATSHDERYCPALDARRRAAKRMDNGPRGVTFRDPTLMCYVCGRRGHLDCNIGLQCQAVLSCYNCGVRGHVGDKCEQPVAHVMFDIAERLERNHRPRGRRRSFRASGEVAACWNFRTAFVKELRNHRYDQKI